MPDRIRVGVLSGGPSAEHDVSLASGKAIAAALPEDRYEPVPIVIGRDGAWPVDLRDGLVDVVFPALHGPFGEDGVVQGYLQTLGIPYVGCGVLASAVAMDKVAMKRAFVAEGLPIAPHVWFTKAEWAAGRVRVEHLGWPMFVKPANMGSSIGITRATTPDELAKGVETAFGFDRVVLVEQGVQGRELTCAVLGDYDDPRTSVIGETQVCGDWLDYDGKYLGTVDNVRIPADVPDSVAKEARELALQAYRAINGYGLARADFLYEQEMGELCLLEINTMPGFTARSVYSRAWTATGLPYPDLLKALIDLAFARSGG